jgi:hypothetical protein
MPTPTTAIRSMSETVASLAALTVKAATAYGRPDLARFARRLEEESRAPVARVAVAGDFKRGKSSFVNALLDTELCPTDEATSSTVPTVFRHGDHLEAVVVRHGDETDTVEVIGVDSLDAIHREPGDIRRVEITLDRALLGLGLEIVDCPAAAGEGHPGRAATVAVARESDAVFFVTGASQPMTAFEIELVDHLTRVCPSVTVVMSRIDMATDWRAVRAIDLDALRSRDLDAEIVPVSSPLRLEALARGDREMNAESGFARVIDILRDGIASRTDGLLRVRAARTLGAIADELLDGLERELHSLTSTETAQRELEDVDAARKAAERMRQANARWQRLLAEGAQDLQSEVEHRLTGVARSIVEQATTEIEEIDPAKDWETFEPSLRDRLIAEVDDVFVRVDAGFESLIDQVAAEFGDRTVADPGPTDRAAALDELHVTSDAGPGRMAVLGGGLTALRGSYSGMLMFGMLGSLFGFALLNPVTVALGLTVGGKALWDERSRLVKTRRTKAVGEVRQFVDQAISSVRAEVRKSIRERQRELRDAFLEHAEERVAAQDAALVKARAAAQATAQERARRRADVDAEIARTRELSRMVQTQLGDSA